MQTLREAVQRYFQENHFGEDGGYASPWVDFKLGPIPFPLPNTDSRRRAVRFHDLHHVLTGYRTDLVGEFEISAWELAAGCKDFHAAWVLNLSGLAGGLFRAPVRTFRAFVRGRHERTSYGMEYEALLSRGVEDLRRELGISDVVHPGRPGDVLRFALLAATGLVVGLLLMAVLLSPITLVLWWRGRAARAGALPAAG
jgi:hypothetical protein